MRKPSWSSLWNSRSCRVGSECSRVAEASSTIWPLPHGYLNGLGIFRAMPGSSARVLTIGSAALTDPHWCRDRLGEDPRPVHHAPHARRSEISMPGQAPPLTDERQLLLAYIAQQRDGIRNAAYGLTDAQARLAPSASSLSIGGLIKHAADIERGWIDRVLQRDRGPEEGQRSDYEDNFRLGPDETLVDVLARYDEVATETATVVAGIADLREAVPVPRGVPWFPDDVESWSVRWVLLHLIEETARHAGHADIVRESIDGATMYELMAAAEGWPATDWLRPWKAPS
jgi:hypothetical protein